MAMRPPVGAPTLNRRTRILLIAAGVLVLLLLGGSRLITFYVDWLWFGEVGYRSVFTTVIFTRILQFLLGAVLIGGANSAYRMDRSVMAQLAAGLRDLAKATGCGFALTPSRRTGAASWRR